MSREPGRPLVVDDDPALADVLVRLASTARMVFVTGLPGTGKSLLVHQLAHLAHERGRRLHVLQWDVVRPVFEASRAGARYPVVEGVTHAVVRAAVGLWSRRAMVAWHRAHADDPDLLVGETPLVGERFMALARRLDDEAEPRLASSACRFVLPVPSADVRRFLEAERERRTAVPLHPREREDAPPAVLRELWRELVTVASALGIEVTDTSAGIDTPEYDPDLYRRVFEALLRHRHLDVVPVDRILRTAAFSVYDLAVPHDEILPAETEASALVDEIVARYPDTRALERDVARWYATS